MTQIELLITSPTPDYELLDSGDGQKLERFGKTIVLRPDPQALWQKRESVIWQKAQAIFTNKWSGTKNVEEDWKVGFGENTFILKLSAFKHVGIFPEQSSNWNWIDSQIRNRKSSDKEVSVLNLFGYTGGATLAALRAGAHVTHVDASKTVINWAKENVKVSGLSSKPVRWILDDVLAFVKREIRRGKKYDAIIFDPPSYGRGPKGESWKIEKDLPELIGLLRELVSNDSLFILMNGYASGYSPIAYKNSLDFFARTLGGSVTCGEVGIQESKRDRILPAGIFARWQRQG